LGFDDQRGGVGEGRRSDWTYLPVESHDWANPKKKGLVKKRVELCEDNIKRR